MVYRREMFANDSQQMNRELDFVDIISGQSINDG